MSPGFCLPEELLLKILASILVLSDDAFTGHAFTDYGAGSFDLSRAHLAQAYPRRPAAPTAPARAPGGALLVCRRWARVGTPLLYEAAVLRTHAQLHALAAALHGARALRPLVRRLRVAGAGAGLAFVDRVVRHTPRLHTLALALDAPDTGFHAFPYPSAGVRAALAQLRPRRLLLEREQGTRNGRADEMLYLVCGAIAQWDSLVRIDLSNYFAMDKTLALAMLQSRSLQYLSMYDCGISRDLSECLRPSCLAVAAQNPRLRAILCRGEDPQDIRDKYPGRIASLLLHDTPQSPTELGIPRP